MELNCSARSSERREERERRCLLRREETTEKMRESTWRKETVSSSTGSLGSGGRLGAPAREPRKGHEGAERSRTSKPCTNWQRSAGFRWRRRRAARRACEEW